MSLLSDLLDTTFDDQDAELRELIRKHLLEMAQMGATGAAQHVADTFGIGIDWELVNRDAEKWAREYSGQLVKDISQNTRQRIREQVATYIGTPGADLQSLIDAIEQRDISEYRASVIAITETTRAYAQGNQSAWQQAGIGKNLWQTNNDEIVCPICQPLNQKVREIGDAFGIDADGAEITAPPAHPNCILPGNEIVIPDLEAASKAFYVGRCVEIVLGNGRSLAVTENHPILTDRGWIAAQFISKGDNVIVARDAEGIAARINPDYEYRPTVVEQIFDSLKMSSLMPAGRMIVTAEDFHGDGRFINGYVDIVLANSLLRNGIEGLDPKPCGKFQFDGRSVGETFLLTDGTTLQIGASALHAFDGGVGWRRERAPFFGGHVGHADIHAARHVAGGDAVLQQALAERPAIDTTLAREFAFRFASKIARQEVVKIRDFDYVGHVYDLQSEIFELYFCNSIIVKNCRCWLSPVVE